MHGQGQGVARKRSAPRSARADATNLAGVTTLPEFLATTGTLTKADRAKVVDQARAMIEGLYVHLPLKRAMHATDPVQRLKLLGFRLGSLSERQFHEEMIDIFTDLRDLHTNYVLPHPYRTKTAFLPFLLEEFREAGARRYLVSKTFAGLADPSFVPGVVVTSWNGIPIERAVELNADRQAGSNTDARLARGLESLTIRTMAVSSPPDELWVVVGYQDGEAEREIRLDWQVFEPDPGPEGTTLFGARGPHVRSLGLDLRTEIARRAKKVLFNPPAMDTERAVQRVRSQRGRKAVALAADSSTTSTMPDVFSFHPVDTPSGTFGYIRIWTFYVPDEDAFVAEFVRMAGLLPQNGLIIDVRGNGGGNILCAEKLLQVLTPRPVEPSYLSFICTPLTLEICTRNSFVDAWKGSIAQSVETGEAYSQSLPLLALDDYNRLGQRYQGPVLLITDPLCYSATDIFSAGFQDNGIGKILSAGGRTGAGGANVWEHGLLRQVLPGPGSPFSPLPKGISFRVSIRRVTRSGSRRGVPLEDLGVEPDSRHEMTRDDVLNGNVDLIAKAGSILAVEPRVALTVSVSAASAGKRVVTATTSGLDRVDVLVDGRPRATADVADGTSTIEIANPGAGRDVVLRGYAAGELRATATVRT